MLIPLAIAGATCNKSPHESNGKGGSNNEIIIPAGDPIETWDSDGFAAWSSTGWIAYLHSDNVPDNPDEDGIYLIRPDGLDKHMVFPKTGFMTDFTWSPDGQWLLYSNSSMLIKLFHDGSIADTILTGLSGAFCPRWSPNGKQIVYHTSEGYLRGIWIVNSDGSNNHHIIPFSMFPLWAYPDSIFYVNFDSAYTPYAICVSDTSGELYSIVYDPTEKFVGGSTVPNNMIENGKLFFTGQIIGELESLWTIDLDSLALNRLTTDEARWIASYLSPNGDKIIGSKCSTVDYHRKCRLWIMDVDGSNRRQLTF